MARPRRQYSGSLSPGQAQYVLQRLISDRRVSATEIEGYVSQMGREISELEQRLQQLRDAAGPAAAAAVVGIAAGVAGAAIAKRGRKRGRPPGRPPGRPGRPPGRPGRPPGRPPKSASASTSTSTSGSTAAAPSTGGKKRGRKAAITPEQRASRQLQGKYLALVRRFPAAKRAQYARTAKEKGREAAIKEMQDAVNK